MKKYRFSISLLLAAFICVNTYSQINRIALAPIDSFGYNLGNLKMFTYIPDGIVGDAPLVVALHGCRQDAKIYAEQTGWNKLADLHKFIVIYPQQDTANNSYSCFSWFNSSFLVNNQLEVLTIKEMVDYMKMTQNIDSTKIFVTGLSAGAGMTSTLMANYPDVFIKGAMMSGIPYRSSSDEVSPFTVMEGIVTKTSGEWGDLVRSARPNYTGAYPDLAIFQGDADTIVDKQNAIELIKQWTAVNDADTIPDKIDNAFRGDSTISLTLYYDSILNEPVVYHYNIGGMHHGIAIDTGDCPMQGGAIGKYAFDRNFHSTYWAADFFNLIKPLYSILGPISISKNAENVIFSAPFDNGASYLWTVPAGAILISGQGTNIITVNMGSTGGLITLTKNNSCENETASIFISLLDFKLEVAQTDTLSCKGDSSANLSVSIAGENGPYTYQWSPGGIMNTDLSGIKAGTYTLTVKDKDTYVINSSTYTITEPETITSERFDTICYGDSLRIGNITFDSTGTFTKHFSSTKGCDSILTIHLTVLPKFTTTQEVSLCAGDSIQVGSSIYKNSGSYTDVFTSVVGCDSTVFTQVNLLPLKTVNQVKSICLGDSLRIGATVHSVSGIYTDTLTSHEGCDSVVTTELEVMPSTIINQSKTICFGDSIQVGMNTYKSSGSYSDAFTSNKGCDSTVITQLTVIPENVVDQNFTLCSGESISVGNNTYSTTGTYTDVFTSFANCDSIVKTHLNLLSKITSSQTFSICEGDSILIGKSTYRNQGSFMDTLTSKDGCDSVITTEIIMLPKRHSNQLFKICSGDSIVVGSSIYKNTGVYMDVLKSFQACDSIVNTQLEVLPAGKTLVQSYTICAGDSIVVGSSVYKTSGTFTKIFTSNNGCDSTVITQLNVNAPLIEHQTVSICAGERYVVGTSTYLSSGNYKDVFKSWEGCDSVVHTNLTVNLPIDLSVISTIEMLGYTFTALEKNAAFQWLDCNNEHAIMNTSTASVFSTPFSGSYAVSITKNNCTDTSSCYNTVVSGITENGISSGIIISPNPFSSSTTVYFSEEHINSQLIIRNMLGEEIRSFIFSGKEMLIEKENLDKGIYFIQLINAKKDLDFIKMVIQ